MKHVLLYTLLFIIMAFPFSFVYSEGNEKNTVESIETLRKLAEQGNVEAQNKLGNAYCLGKSVEKNYKEAIKWYRKAAEQGLAIAQGKLGYIYWLGEGVEMNCFEAVKWITKGAKQGDSLSTEMMGVLYFLGSGVEQDCLKAYAWTSLSVKKGNMNSKELMDSLQKEMSPAQISKAIKLSEKYEKGIFDELTTKDLSSERSLEKSNKENLNICLEKIKLYDEKIEEVDKLYPNLSYKEKLDKKEEYAKERFVWLNKAADQGDINSCYRLSTNYLYGILTKKDPAKAMVLLKKAADNNHTGALYSLGIYYYNGIEGFLPKDKKEAFKYYMKAAEQGHPDSCIQVAYYYINLDGVDVMKTDKEEAFKWLKKAAEKSGYVDEEVLQKYLPEKEEWLKKDYVEIIERNANNGDSKAQVLLGRMYEYGSYGKNRNLREAYNWYIKSKSKDVAYKVESAVQRIQLQSGATIYCQGIPNGAVMEDAYAISINKGTTKHLFIICSFYNEYFLVWVYQLPYSKEEAILIDHSRNKNELTKRILKHYLKFAQSIPGSD